MNLTYTGFCVLPSSLSCGCGWGCQQHMLFVAPFQWSKLEHCAVQWSCPSIAQFYWFSYFPVYVDGAHTRSVTWWEILPKLENYNNYTSVRCSICVSVSLLSSVFDSSLSSESEIFSTNSSLSNVYEISLGHRLFLLLEAKFAYWNSYLSAQYNAIFWDIHTWTARRWMQHLFTVSDSTSTFKLTIRRE